MGKYVTETGFNKRTYQDLVEYYTTIFKSVFGDDVNLDPEQATGALLDYLASTDAEVWDVAQDTWTANDVRNAVGVSLDNNIGALINVLREDATKAQVRNVVCFGDQGTIVPTGTRVRNSTTLDADRVTFETDADVTIDAAAAREVWYEVDLQSGLAQYLITMDAQVYSITGDFPNEEQPIDALAAAVNAAVPQLFNAEKIFNDDGEPRLRVWYDQTIPESQPIPTFAIGATQNMNVDQFGSPVDVTALLEGFVAVGIGFISEIATGVTGFKSVYNTDSKTLGTGTGVELDPAYRKRLQLSITGTGLATEDAIRRVVLNDVQAVSACVVRSNRTMTAFAAGAPFNGQAPKSFQTYVDGVGVLSGPPTEVQQALAEAIFKAAPAGIEIFGTEGPIEVEDDDGEKQNVYYSIVQGVAIEVNVYRDKYEEFNPYPTNGDQLIKDALVAYARDNWVLDKDVITSRLIPPIYLAVQGVGEVQIEARIKGSGDPFSSDTIPIDSTSVATLDETDITVADIP
jgi:hypothetical protein